MADDGAVSANAQISSFHAFVLLILLSLLPGFITNFPPVTNAASIAAVDNSWRAGGANTVNCDDGSAISPILVSNTLKEGRAFACGFFYCRGCNNHLFSVFLVYYNNSRISPKTAPQVIWSANRNITVSGNATLKLSVGGELQLLNDTHDDPVWSSNTHNLGVVSMKLTEQGNLVLMDEKNHTVWQSYDHPTDTALVGQNITGKILTSNRSSTGSIFSFTFINSSFIACIDGGESIPQMYFKSNGTQYNGVWLPLSDEIKSQDSGQKIVSKGTGSQLAAYTKRFVRIEVDGHLRRYQWWDDVSYGKWEVITNDDGMRNDYRGECMYPTKCAKFGVCDEGQCSCPNDQYLKSRHVTIPNEGCEQVKPWSCGQPAQLVLYEDTAYFGYVQAADIPNTYVDKCKEACLRSCSCQAAFFKYRGNVSEVRGDCYLPSTIYSLIHNNETVSNFNSSAFIKIPNDETSESNRRRQRSLALEITIPVISVLLILCGIVSYKRRHLVHQRAKGANPEGENGDNDTELFKFDHLPCMPTRFSFNELKDATDGFARKLGEGGFGAVFQGSLRDGTQIAVKILGYRGQGMKEFLAEVVTVGSIHHHNLVRLVGYCAERLHRLLVYEYLSNGSLDKWIFHDEKDTGSNSTLDLDTKQKIILDVARGLSYLHEDCRNKIIHMDIKPQNILLDAGFNAKVSDFGLSKLIDRNQSEVITTLRGTPGYLAPEWLNSVITEKVDVYSFGVVVLEMVSGKRILDYSRSQRSLNLVSLLSKATEEGRLLDLIGVNSVDEEKALKLVKIATWCLQVDFTERPSMSTVVKVLEGLVDVEPMLKGLRVFASASSMSLFSSDTGGSSMSKSAPFMLSDVAGPR